MASTLTKAIPLKVVTHPEPPNGLWGNVVKPYPTGAFWTNFVIRNGDYPVAVLPYAVKCLESGIQVSYGAWRRSVSQLYVQDVFAPDLQISSYQSYVSRGVEGYDGFSVGMAYKTASAGKYKGQFVKGSPFITVLYDSATPVISSMVAKMISVEFRVNKGSPGVQYMVTLSNNQKWLVYCSETIPLVWKDNTLTSPYPIHGFVRVAFLPPQNCDSAFGVLINYVQKYPTGVTMSFAYPSNSQAVVTYQFTTVGTGSLVMLALPHHLQVLTSPADSDESRRTQGALNPLYCMKGKLKAIIGDAWKLTYALPNVLLIFCIVLIV